MSRFWVDFGSVLDPIWGPRREQEEPQEEPKSSQDEVAVENAAKSKMCVSWVGAHFLGLGVAQDEPS